ncbi:hypothetical protein CR513_43736, partial [Mucuna pruriens]
MAANKHNYAIVDALHALAYTSTMFAKDVRNFKATKFLDLKQGNKIVIQQVISYQEICQCPSLVNRCKILDKDNKARVVHCKVWIL